MNDFTKLQKEYAVRILRIHQQTFITHNAKDAKREFAKNCLVGALEIAILTLEGEVSNSGKTNSNRIRGMSDEELADWFGKIQYDTAYYCAGEDKQKYPYPDGWLDWLKLEVWDD